MYHYVELPETDTEAGSLVAHIVKHTGDVDIVARHGYLPVKLVPPYEYMGEDEEVHDTLICGCYPGERIYIGMLGGTHCASYEIAVSRYTSNETCTETAHMVHEETSDGLVELECGKMQLGSCDANGWFDHSVEVTQHMLDVSDNLVFETELLYSATNLEAISLHLFKGSIPLDRLTEITATSSDSGTYSIAIPSTDLQLDTYYLSIKCGAQAQRFRSVVFEVRGGLVGIGDAVHGEVCPVSPQGAERGSCCDALQLSD